VSQKQMGSLSESQLIPVPPWEEQRDDVQGAICEPGVCV
jgi:hypothetical protein